MVGDFNSAILKQFMPNFHKNVPYPTRGDNTLDHCYSPFNNGYKATFLPSFRKSDHATILLTPEYKQRLLQEALVMTQTLVRLWTAQSEAPLQVAHGAVNPDKDYKPSTVSYMN